MSRRSIRKGLSLLLTAALLLSLTIAAVAAPPAPPPGGGSRTFYYADDQDGYIETELADGTYTNTAFPAYSKAETFGNSVRAKDARVVSLINPYITKNAGTFSGGDDASFYGVNSALLVCDYANVTVDGGAVVSDNAGANGIFCYGNATTTLKDVTVVTEKGGSGGIMVAGGGTMYAQNCNVWTEGGSSAAIRSDRGSGLQSINGGTYVSNGSQGTGSPAIYCVADVTVSNATLIARNAQAMCFEGRNPGKLYNCYLEGNYTASDDDEASNVMVYQSMSGDAAEGTSYFTMVDGVLKDNCALSNAKMFYTTNTYCYISLANVEMRYATEDETFLLCACNSNRRTWGTAGANGSECGLYCVDQEVKGDIIYDTYSFLSCFFTQGTHVRSAILCREDNGVRGCDVYMDASSTWTLTADSIVRDLYTGGAAITCLSGNTATIKAPDGTVYVQGNGMFSVTVTGTYSEEDHSATTYMPKIGTAETYDFNVDALRSEFEDTSFDPAAVDADACVKPVVSATASASVEDSLAAGLNTSPEVVISQQALEVNGVAVAPACYNCDGYNYFKLRDVAALLKDTTAAFAVSFDAAANAVVIETGKAYQPLDTDLQPVAEATKILVSPQAVLLDGAPVELDVYSINDNNYFKLRDLGEVLGFAVDYDEATRTMLVNAGGAAPAAQVYDVAPDTAPVDAPPAGEAPAGEAPAEDVPADDGMGGQGNALTGVTAKAPTQALYDGYVQYLKDYLTGLTPDDLAGKGDGGMDASAVAMALAELDTQSYETADLSAFPFEMYVTLFGAQTFDGWNAG